MSGTYNQNALIQPQQIPLMRAGEIDGRQLDCTPDLGSANGGPGDTFPSISVLSIAITREDNQPMGSNDLQPAGSAWPNTLDETRLIPEFGFNAPAGAAGVTYRIALTANKTTQGQLFIRDFTMLVSATVG